MEKKMDKKERDIKITNLKCMRNTGTDCFIINKSVC